MADLKQPLGEKLRKAGLLLLLIVGALLAGWWSMQTQDASTAATCIALYRQARSEADTAAIDVHAPIINKKDALTGLSCGTLRQRGALE